MVTKDICFYDAQIDTISNGRDKGIGFAKHFDEDFDKRLDWLFPHTRKSDDTLILS